MGIPEERDAVLRQYLYDPEFHQQKDREAQEILRRFDGKLTGLLTRDLALFERVVLARVGDAVTISPADGWRRAEDAR